jgi:hypothetical protein
MQLGRGGFDPGDFDRHPGRRLDGITIHNAKNALELPCSDRLMITSSFDTHVLISPSVKMPNSVMRYFTSGWLLNSVCLIDPIFASSALLEFLLARLLTPLFDTGLSFRRRRHGGSINDRSIIQH